MYKPYKQLWGDILFIELGVFISAVGISLFYGANLGSSPMATFCDGIHHLLHISYGAAYSLANLFFMIVLAVIKLSYIGVGTVLCGLTTGVFIDAVNYILAPLNLSSYGITIRLLLAILGIGLMGVGLGMYVAMARGYGALEGFVIYFSEKFKVSKGFIKVVEDVLLVFMGYLLGAKIGIASILAVLLTGPILNRSVTFFHKLRGKDVKK